MFDNFKFAELIVSRMRAIINMHRVLALGGSKPPPYDEHLWQAEHPAVHRMQLAGQIPRPTTQEKLASHCDLPVFLFHFSAKNTKQTDGDSFSPNICCTRTYRVGTPFMTVLPAGFRAA